MKAAKYTGRFLLSLLGWGFTLACSAVIIGCIGLILLFHHYAQDLPDYSQLADYNPPTVTRLYAGDGRLLAEYATEKRVFVPLVAIPARVKEAFLSAEDKNFYKHTGIDLTGIGRAIYTNIVFYGQGKSLVGGSTITQQVVKNFLLTNEKSFQRKIKEAILALRISQTYSKEKILELYLNEIYLGQRSYGVAAAALNYFNKSLDELTIEEAALLAAMPKGPSLYDPKKNYEEAKNRRDWVINRMREDEHITKEEASTAIDLPITLRSRASDDVVSAEFFSEEVRRWLAAKYGENVIYEGGLVVKTTLDPKMQHMADQALRRALIEYDRRRGYRGAVKHLPNLTNWKAALAQSLKEDHHLVDNQTLAVVTATDDKKASLGFADGKTGTIPFSLMKWTRKVVSDGVLGPEIRKPADVVSVGDIVIVGPLDAAQSKSLNEAERKTAWDLEQVPAVNGALVAIDPHTGKVLAMSGGYAYGGTEFNRATQAKRQPGSSFKPFAYMAGLENGFTPSTILMDAPVEMSQGAGMPTWKPQNYHDDYLGPTTLRVGLEKSRNTMTVRLAQIVGIDKILEMGKRMGIYENPPRNFSIVLGAAETTLLKLTNAYAMVANGGKKLEPTLIERIDDRHGKVIYRRDNRSCPTCAVSDFSTLQKELEPPQLPDNREQMVDPRVAYQITSMMEGVVQRGTATRAKSLGRPIAGKTGTTNDSLDTWFVGYSPDLVAGVFVGYDRPKTLGKKETGASVALPGFIYFMEKALADTPAKPFRIPPGIQLVRVNLHTGQAIDPNFDTGGTIIQEAFVTGDPIFKPGMTPPAAEKSDSDNLLPDFNKIDGDNTTPAVARPSSEPPAPLPWRQQNPDVIQAVPPAPVVIDPGVPADGTGGLY